jgi:hypothetical protein
MKLKNEPSIKSIISIGDRDFITGHDKHIIRFWRLLSEDEDLQVTRTGDIKGRHRSAVNALAMSGNTLWSSSGCRLLGTDTLRMQTVLEPIIRASSTISQIHYQQRFLILEVRVRSRLRVITDALAQRRGIMIHLSAYTIQGKSVLLKMSPCSNSVCLRSSHHRVSAKEGGSTPLLCMGSPTLSHRWSSYCFGI